MGTYCHRSVPGGVGNKILFRILVGRYEMEFPGMVDDGDSRASCLVASSREVEPWCAEIPLPPCPVTVEEMSLDGGERTARSP